MKDKLRRDAEEFQGKDGTLSGEKRARKRRDKKGRERRKEGKKR